MKKQLVGTGEKPPLAALSPLLLLPLPRKAHEEKGGDRISNWKWKGFKLCCRVMYELWYLGKNSSLTPSELPSRAFLCDLKFLSSDNGSNGNLQVMSFIKSYHFEKETWRIFQWHFPPLPLPILSVHAASSEPPVARWLPSKCMVVVKAGRPGIELHEDGTSDSFQTSTPVAAQCDLPYNFHIWVLSSSRITARSHDKDETMYDFVLELLCFRWFPLYKSR